MEDELYHKLNHKLKNNLQLINSILNIQAYQFNNEEVNLFLKKGQRRIKSILILNSFFSIEGNSKEFLIKEYVCSLFDSLFEIHEKDKNAYEIEIIEHELKIKTEYLFHVGLILNELLSNAILHAFNANDNRKQNKIIVSLKSVEPSKYILLVSDNGIGLNKVNKNGLGLELVSLLTQQLNGEFKTDTLNGTKHTILF